MATISQKVQELPEDLINVIKGYVVGVEKRLKARVKNLLFCRKMVESQLKNMWDWNASTRDFTLRELVYDESFEYAKRDLRIRITPKTIIVYGRGKEFKSPNRRFLVRDESAKIDFIHHVRKELYCLWWRRQNTILDRVWEKAGAFPPSRGMYYKHSEWWTMEHFNEDLCFEDDKEEVYTF
jgi:hypothetical protein